MGTSLSIGFCVSPGGNVDRICFFMQEIFIKATVPNKADKAPVFMELYYLEKLTTHSKQINKGILSGGKKCSEEIRAKG